MPRRPIPAAARYMAAGDPRPPAPMQRTLPFFNFRWASMPISGMIRCRLYRLISSADSVGSSFVDAGLPPTASPDAAGLPVVASADVGLPAVASAEAGAPPATDGTMLSESPALTGV